MFSTASKSIQGKLVAFGLAAALLAAGCGGTRPKSSAVGPGEAPAPTGGDTVYSLADEVGEQLDRFADAMARVKQDGTVEQARRAKQAAAEVAAEIQAIAGRLQRLEVPPDEVKREIAEQGREREQAIRDRLGTQSELIEGLDPEVAAIVREVMRSFRSELEEPGAIFDRYFEALP